MIDRNFELMSDISLWERESHHFQHNVPVWLDRVSGGVAAERPTGAQRDLLHTDLYCTESHLSFLCHAPAGSLAGPSDKGSVAARCFH